MLEGALNRILGDLVELDASDWFPLPQVQRLQHVPADRLALSVDRKSTRLNSSHRCISYAVFCLSPLYLLLHSFPTRRSSDLAGRGSAEPAARRLGAD